MRTPPQGWLRCWRLPITLRGGEGGREGGGQIEDRVKQREEGREEEDNSWLPVTCTLPNKTTSRHGVLPDTLWEKLSGVLILGHRNVQVSQYSQKSHRT